MLLANEWRYLIRQPLTWIACAAMAFMAYLFAQGIGGIDTLADKRLQALHITFLMMSLPLLCGAMTPLIFLRDQINGMSELILVTPQSVFSRCVSRFLMLFFVCAGLLFVGFFIMLFMLSLTYGFEMYLLALTVWDFMFMAVPASAFFCAAACYLTTRFSSNVVIYASFCSFWLMYLVLASMTGSPMLAGSSISSPLLFELMRFLDPFGITALLAHYQPPKLNLFGDLIFYFNRFVYCIFALGLMYHSLNLKPYKAKHVKQQADLIPKRGTAQPLRFVNATPHTMQQLIHLSGASISLLLRQRLNQLILVGWTILMFNEVLSGISYAEPLAVLQPTSLDALNRISDDVLPLMGCFLLLFWSWQLCWRNRQDAMGELISCTPISSVVITISQVIALGSLVVLLMLLTSIASLLAEMVAGSEIQPIQYLTQLGMATLSLTLIASIFTALHTIFRSALVAVSGCIAVLAMKYTPLSGKLGLTHTMWNVASSPLQSADAFWGLEQSVSLYWPFMTFWVLLTVTLIFVASQWSHRTTGYVNHKRWKFSLTSGVLLALTVVTGLNLHNNIITERPLMSSDMREQWRANYELDYANWENIAQPSITDVDAKVDIFPEQGKAKFSLIYTLINRTEQPIDKMLVGHNSATPLDALDLSVAHSSTYDQSLGQYIVSLNKAIQPGEQLQLSTKLTFKQPQHWPAVMHQWVKPSFSYLRGVPLLPIVGFQPQYRLRDELLREEYGLKPLNLLKPSSLFAKPQLSPPSYDWVNVHSIVSTHATQVPLAQGALIKKWQKNQRNYAQYQTNGPIRHALVWLSASQNSIKHQVGSTMLEVFSPTNSDAAQLNMQAMQDTVAWMSTHIAPYRGNRLSLIAIPDVGPTGYALPQIMMINHKVGFRAQPSSQAGFDQRYRRAAHETAHQWFGHDIGNGVLEDSAFLVESLAKYIELVMIEQQYGIDAMQALVDFERQRYKLAVMGSTEQTVALVDATESYDMYSRATLVFAILRQHIGDEIICKALRQLWQQHAYPLEPATSMDFVRLLKAQVDESQQTLVDSMLLGTDINELLGLFIEADK